MSNDDDRIAYLAGADDAGQRLADDERAELKMIRDLLADPTMWAEPDASLEDSVVAAVSAEAAQHREAHNDASRIDLGPSESRRSTSSKRRRRIPIVSAGIAAGAAAAVALAMTVGSLGGGSGPTFSAALAGPSSSTPLSGSAQFTRTNAGWRIQLHTRGLPRLDDGRFYEAWMKNEAGVLVSIGTFNQGPDVTLWSGVSPAEFTVITVTAEAADGNPASSGQRVFVGNIRP